MKRAFLLGFLCVCFLLHGGELDEARNRADRTGGIVFSPWLGSSREGDRLGLRVSFPLGMVARVMGQNSFLYCNGWTRGNFSLALALGGIVEISSIRAYGGPELSFAYALEPGAPVWGLETGGFGGVEFLYSPGTRFFLEVVGTGSGYQSDKSLKLELFTVAFRGGLGFEL